MSYTFRFSVIKTVGQQVLCFLFIFFFHRAFADLLLTASV